jgi:hypothetical protein
MIKGFKNLRKKDKSFYAHVSIPPPPRRVRKVLTIKESPRSVNKGRKRMAGLAIAMHSRAASLNSRMNRVGSVLANEPNWHGSQKLLGNLVRTGIKIGAQSVHGVVKRLRHRTSMNRYVIKTIKFKQQRVIVGDAEQPKLRWFREEVAIGQLPHIEAVGPRIHAWRLRPDGAEYVMDNVEMGDPNSKTYTYYQLNRKYPGAFKEILTKALNLFHSITKGQHGDLHGDNILFVKHGPRMDIRIIDYGSWKSDKNTNMTLENAKASVPVYRLASGRLFRLNDNMLKHLFKRSMATS